MSNLKNSSYATKALPEILNELNSTENGLTTEQAKKKLQITGPNEITSQEKTAYTILLRQFHSPFLYLLLAAAIFSIFLGEIIDGVMILIFVTINTSLGFYQEYRSEKTLELLKEFVIAKAKIKRDSTEQLIKSREIVPGDIIILRPGDNIPCDVRFIRTENLLVDESILTGESVAVSKTSDTLKNDVSEIYKAQNLGFSGTTVVSGEAIGIVIKTAKDTEIGMITSLATETKHESSFQKGIGRLSNFILKLILITLVGIIFINILIKGTDQHIPTLIIFAIALAISVIPEALPVVTTFSFSRGALRLAKNKVVVKRLSAIEDLGSIEVLCTDKTGTITENHLEVASYFPKNNTTILMGTLATAILEKGEVPTDSFDIALISALPKEILKEYQSYNKVSEVPFDPKRRRNCIVLEQNGKITLLVRGALESVLPLCKKLTENSHHEITQWAKEEGKKGHRVIALAKKHLPEAYDKNISSEEKDLDIVGLISFVDPLKKTAQAAIRKAEKLGVKIKILTGDSKDVAGAIAFQTGLISDPASVLTGDEFESLSLDKQHTAVTSYNVFARVSPEQKHKIIKLLQEKNEVGYLGEGINDAPALKAANVGIVVQSASDIAKEASDIVLLNKSLHVVVDGIKEGREIFGNTAKYIKSTLASNFGNFYTLAIASLFIPFLPLLPLQILLINLLTDFPMISIATDNVDTEELRRPRNYDVREIALFATIMGIISSFIDFLFFILFYKTSPHILQTNWFIGSVLTELVFVFSVRTRVSIFKSSRPSNPLIILSCIAFITALVLPFTQFGHSIFEFITPSSHDIFLILILTISYFITTEIVKVLYYKFINGKNTEEVLSIKLTK